MGGKVAKPARQADNAASGQGGDRAASVEGGAKKLEAGETSYHSKESRKDVSPGSAMKLLEAQESGWKDEDDKNGRTPISPFGKHVGGLSRRLKYTMHVHVRLSELISRKLYREGSAP